MGQVHACLLPTGPAVPSPILSLSAPDSTVKEAPGNSRFGHIQHAIRQASLRTGVDFSYLMNKASQESGFDPNAKAATSSATGLFQFTSQTWLRMIKQHGDEYGLGHYADKITIDRNGVAQVGDPGLRSAILAMRKDPAIASQMAGQLDKDNLASLKADIGGKIGPTELYLAHFFGAGGAGNFIESMRKNPDASAAKILPEAAAANHSVFYDKSGAPRSVSQIYRQFAQKFERAPDYSDPAPAAMVAANTAHDTGYAKMASADNAHAAYTPSVMSSRPLLSGTGKTSASSLFSTMVLAQMDMRGAGISALGASLEKDDRQKTLVPSYLPIA